MRLFAIIMSNGATSLVSLMITVVIARQDGPSQLGVFGVSFAVLLLAQLFAREVGINRALSDPGDPFQRQVAYSRSLLVGLAVGIPLVLVGLALLDPIVILTGLAVPGYTAFTFLRLLTVTDGRVGRGLFADSVLVSCVALASLSVVVFDISSLVVLTIWALLLPISGALLQRKIGLRLKANWYSSSSTYSGISFGFQSLFGSGSVHISTFILASLFGSVLVGAVRGASTLMGPVNLVTSSINTLSIRELATESEAQRRRTMLLWFVISTGICGVGAFLTWLISVLFGSWILGESWPVVEPLVAWVALDAAIVATAVAARAAHRVDKRGAAAWRVSIISGGARLLFLPLGGWWAGATGVAIALAVTSLLSGTLWWLSYVMYRKQSRPASGER